MSNLCCVLLDLPPLLRELARLTFRVRRELLLAQEPSSRNDAFRLTSTWRLRQPGRLTVATTRRDQGPPRQGRQWSVRPRVTLVGVELVGKGDQGRHCRRAEA